MNHAPKPFLLALAFILLGLLPTSAHEGVGRAGLKPPHGVEIETEFYAGRRGYIHGGLGVIAPLNPKQEVGLTAHFVREESGGEIFPSLGAEWIQKLGGDFELEAFSFGYFPVEQQQAWAVGLRGSRRFAVGESVSISPFFGPTYARTRAFDEAADTPANIDHLMLFGGVAVEAERVGFTLFASHSFFSRDPVGLETHVDLEEMTHFAAYENNDGFARHSVGAEISYSIAERISLAGRYALILYDDQTRHSFSITPSVKVADHFEVFAGIQLLRGDGADNDLGLLGVASSF